MLSECFYMLHGPYMIATLSEPQLPLPVGFLHIIMHSKILNGIGLYIRDFKTVSTIPLGFACEAMCKLLLLPFLFDNYICRTNQSKLSRGMTGLFFCFSITYIE